MTYTNTNSALGVFSKKLRTTLKLIQIVVGLAISLSCLSSELEGNFISTLAYELLELEFDVGEPEANSKRTLLKAIAAGVAAAKRTGITKP